MTARQAAGTVRALADGTEIPILGLGVWQVRDGRTCEDAVRWALEAGYRHVDTAQYYRNEGSVGRAVRDSGLPRDEVFVTTKFDPGRRDPAAELERSLDSMGLDFVDLYLVHWPGGGPTRAWNGMQRALERGLTRSIGVSNYSATDIETLLGVADSLPTVNQIQFSPFEYRRALKDTCERLGVAVQAYSPLGTGQHLRNPTVTTIADRLERTPAQILIRWSLQRGLIALPKSSHRDRIASNADVFDFDLSDDDMTSLDALDRTNWTNRSLEHPWW
ncbi:aldo/keto reductase [Actinoplanes couchii]|uniref:2,5-diketo-D-gluconic acid reductase n=1 Tax=Actinoplanes couchii TaxID=403638 RepID=A0ABQ3XHZ5_9ACTN|nr:aldo/keto reductase [Actinoplanes couchii]MDR6317719.1 diketogulonate reductase-like aldo/keto reductase [Actinoplanes couchii]GID58103.1 2,5-diketo-D-gluconic acid reductase [Actinoplanes couchii]